jgi:rare lipoprotein A
LKISAQNRSSIRSAIMSGALGVVLAVGVELWPAPVHASLIKQDERHDRAQSRREVRKKLFALASTSKSQDARLAESGAGIASVYNNEPTASGERMAPGAMAAAHRTLPFGTKVTVVNHRNGRSAVVRINDRGPFVRGRVIDLSPAAAQVLGVHGLAPVSLIVDASGVKEENSVPGPRPSLQESPQPLLQESDL